MHKAYLEKYYYEVGDVLHQSFANSDSLLACDQIAHHLIPSRKDWRLQSDWAIVSQYHDQAMQLCERCIKCTATCVQGWGFTAVTLLALQLGWGLWLMPSVFARLGMAGGALTVVGVACTPRSCLDHFPGRFRADIRWKPDVRDDVGFMPVFAGIGFRMQNRSCVRSNVTIIFVRNQRLEADQRLKSY